MNSTLQRPQPTERPDAGVIKEARRRQRQRLAATAIVGAVAVGAAAWGIAGGDAGAPSVGARSRGAPSPAASSTHDSAGCPVLQGRLNGRPEASLLSILGVLRRPATAADRLPADVSGVGEVFARYVRRTRIIGGRSYYLYPARQGCRPGHEGIADAAVNVDLGHGLLGGVGGGGASASQIDAGEAVSTGPPGSDTSATITMIVPDGVRSVTLRYPAGRASGYSARISPPFTATTRPIGNEVVLTVPRSAGGGPIWKPTMIWRSANARILRVFHRL